MQKELSETYELLRELKTRVGIIASDMDGRLDRFEAYYKDAFEKMQKQIDFETTSLKDGLGQFMNQIWPKIALLDKMDGRFDKIMTM